MRLGEQTPPPAAEPTRDDLIAFVVAEIDAMIDAANDQRVESINRGRRKFWQNERGVTPGELAAKIGPQLRAFFLKNAAEESFLVTRYPALAGRIWQPPYERYLVRWETDAAGQPTGRGTITPRKADGTRWQLADEVRVITDRRPTGYSYAVEPAEWSEAEWPTGTTDETADPYLLAWEPATREAPTKPVPVTEEDQT